VFSIQSAKDSLKRMADGDLDSSVQFSSEEPVTETVTVKNQKTSDWFI
jgi:hypothetical protein